MSATVVSVEEVAGATGRTSFTETSFRRDFIVTLSAADVAGSDIAMNAASIPAKGTLWPYAVTGRRTPWVTEISSQLVSSDNHKIWKVTASYSNATTSNNTEAVALPWNEPAVWSSSAVEYEIALEEDRSETPVQVRNSAGDQFDPLPAVPHTNRMISVQVNTQNFSEDTIDAMINTVNDASVTLRGKTYAPGTLRMIRWQAQGGTYVDDEGASQTYYQNSIDIEVSTFEHGHKLKILNQGFREKDAAGKLTRIMDDSKPPKPATQPSLLAEDGTKLPEDGEPVFLEFEQFKSIYWSNALSGLGL